MAKSVRPMSWVKQLTLGLGALATVGFTAQHVRPIYAGRAPVVRELLEAREWGDSALARAPWASGSGDVALLSPQFEIDRRAFMEDLMRTSDGVTPGRADSVATFAVREAYRRRVPPALVFGVLMVENQELKSSARSNAGAVGLMQIDASTWVSALGKRFGTNLRNDETNLRYGVFILSHLLYDSDDDSPADSVNVHGSLRRGLLRYNGCVRGTNTKNCFRYPEIVRTRINTQALSQCGFRGYERCVAEPLRYVLDD